jgi:hypothetical protein
MVVSDAAERVGPFFNTDGGVAHVSRINLDFVFQGKKFVPDTADQGVEITAGKIGSADGAGKEGIAHKHRFFQGAGLGVFSIEADTAGVWPGV